MEHTPLFRVNTETAISKDLLENINTLINISGEELIEHNHFYGFRQLAEVAVKALSPGINDPGTAVQSLKALVELLAFRIQNPAESRIADKAGSLRIVTREHSFDELFYTCILPIWDYGKKDRLLQLGLKDSLTQLERYGNHACIAELLKAINAEIEGSNTYS